MGDGPVGAPEALEGLEVPSSEPWALADVAIGAVANERVDARMELVGERLGGYGEDGEDRGQGDDDLAGEAMAGAGDGAQQATDAPGVLGGPVDVGELALEGLVAVGGEGDAGVRDDGVVARSCKGWYDAGFRTSGSYRIDPDGPNGAKPVVSVYCDQVSAGGGWTRLVAWDAASGSKLANLTSQLTQLHNSMGEWADRTGYSEWSDWDSGADILVLEKLIDFPNAAEVRLDVKYTGTSMEDSAVWILGIADGVQKDILCGDRLTGQGNLSTAWTAAERTAAYPTYTCSNAQATSDTFSWDTVVQADLGTALSAFRLHSMHWDGGGGDSSWLYRLNAWVR